ncbi:MAG: 16S rRNA (guanine(527)-N(7))-methyltransferase RsmG [Helicobacter trogontum]|uniref:16S rRNA (guanine(527)-N(7))-methyltransferase RsmG n=1 Tax=Helicobacter trogontum TaxID=50960 RepID=UPI000CF046D5|nr:16S rRNA (guanine(527)-N(7))-methyltransferase RsmG [Helicobacter trogontum]MCI5785893.1 16S rRNA (guanine(527)-N(7))-methyltransferase RsmG [Helicobacter trogontum]
MQSIDYDIKAIISQPRMAKPLESFSKILLQWAKIHNLTAIKDSKVLYHQIVDSLLPIFFLKPFHTCIDIGSGAGFPALILACYYTESQFYLLEPRKKRVSFLENAIVSMGLSHVKVIADYSYNVRDLQGDLISSRAVCRSDILVHDSKHLLESNGHYLLYKGTNTAHEIDLLSNMQTQTFTSTNRTYIYAKFS